MKNNITLSEKAQNVIASLQHPAGIYEIYSAQLTKVFNILLYQSDEIDMPGDEALEALRTIGMIREDLATLANVPAPEMPEIPDNDEDSHDNE
jgi:hypothetical protein